LSGPFVRRATQTTGNSFAKVCALFDKLAPRRFLSLFAPQWGAVNHPHLIFRSWRWHTFLRRHSPAQKVQTGTKSRTSAVAPTSTDSMTTESVSVRLLSRRRRFSSRTSVRSRIWSDNWNLVEDLAADRFSLRSEALEAEAARVPMLVIGVVNLRDNDFSGLDFSFWRLDPCR
jgi:hypothetical protein